jgi:hypothetical protein
LSEGLLLRVFFAQLFEIFNTQYSIINVQVIMTTFKKTLFFLGILLLGINISGLFKSLRNPAIYSEEDTKRVSDITIKYPAVKDQLVRKAHEADKEFAVRITNVVTNGMLHYWKDDGLNSYNERVPVSENYLLFAASFIDPGKYRKYEFSNYKKNLERGVGLCSTSSIVLKGVLNDNGIDASLWDIAGHVVVRAKVDNNEWWILDADYGIVVPHDTAAIEANPDIVRPAYADLAGKYKPYAPDPYTTDTVVKIYGKEGNHIYTVNNRFEYFSYWAIWVIPWLLMLPFSFHLLKRK